MVDEGDHTVFGEAVETMSERVIETVHVKRVSDPWS